MNGMSSATQTCRPLESTTWPTTAEAAAETEGYDVDRFVDGDLAETLQCSICLGVVRDPRQCGRQHMFCKLCLDSVLASVVKNGKKPSCPVCRCDVGGESEIQPAQRVVVQILDGLLIRCQFFERGCDKVTKLHALSDHEKRCVFWAKAKVRPPYPPADTAEQSLNPFSLLENVKGGKPGLKDEQSSGASLPKAEMIPPDDTVSGLGDLSMLLAHMQGKTDQQDPRRKRKPRKKRRTERNVLRLKSLLRDLDDKAAGLSGPALGIGGSVDFHMQPDPKLNAFSEWESTLSFFLFAGWIIGSGFFPHFMSHSVRKQGFAALVVLSEFWSFRDHSDLLCLVSGNNYYGLKLPLIRRLVQKALVNFIFTASLLLPPSTPLLYCGALTLAVLFLWSELCPDHPATPESLLRMLRTWDGWQAAGILCALWYNLRLSPEAFNIIILAMFLHHLSEYMPVVRHPHTQTGNVRCEERRFW